MSFVQQQPRPVTFFQLHNFRQGSAVAIHAENRFGHHQDPARFRIHLSPRPLKMTGEFLEIIVWIHPHRRTTEPGAIDERGMTKLVENDDITLSHQGRERSNRRGIATRKSERRFGPFEIGQSLFRNRQCGPCVPQTSREEPEPVPKRSTPSIIAAFSRSSVARPR